MNRLQRKPNQWSCAITALAMALHRPVAEVVAEAGHDGSEIIFPHLMEPMKRRGFHHQELIMIAWRHGYSMTPLELFPRTLSTDGQHTYSVCGEVQGRARFTKAVKGSCGILEGIGHRCSHAIYNHYGQLYDPDPDVAVYDFSQKDCEYHGFYANRLWIFQRHELGPGL
jgi:hypothetical protein